MKHVHKDGSKACTWCDPKTNPVPRLKKEPLVLEEREETLTEHIMRVGEDAYEDEVIEAIRKSESEEASHE